MNVVLFVTDLNLGGIESFVDKFAELQTEKVNGALVVVHQDTVPSGKIAELVAPIVPLFPSTALGTIPISINRSFKNDGRVGSMFATFIMKAYTKYPGPWLVVDDFAVPKVEQFMTKLDKQHGGFGGLMSGRALVEQGAITPVGPVVVNLLAKNLKSLLSHNGESWRSRGRYLFSRVNFGLVSADDYLFSLSESENSKASAVASNPKVTQKVEVAPALKPKFDSSKLDGAPKAQGIATVLPASQAEINEAANKAALENANISAGTVTPVADTKPELREGFASTQVLEGSGVSAEDQRGKGEAIQEGLAPEGIPETHPDEKGQEEVLKTEVTGGDGQPPPLPLTEISHGDVAPDISSIRGAAYDTLSRNELYNVLWARTGEKPHPRIGDTTIIKRLEEIDIAG